MLWCATKSTISGIAILAVATALGVVDSWQALWVIPAVFLIGLCFAGPAMIMASFATNYDFFNYYFVLVVTPMFIVCGVFYPIDTLPAAMLNVVQLLPLTHAVALARPLVTGIELTQPLLHIGVLAAYALLGFYIAVALVRKRLLV
jgi:lipooligosaccharide transport system permease protein